MSPSPLTPGPANRRMRSFATLALAFLVLVAIAVIVWASTSVERGLQKAKEGTVIDMATGRPIAGAWVVVRWYRDESDRWPVLGHGGRGGRTCVYRAVATTDEWGHYLIASTEKQFPIERRISLKTETRFFWDLSAYAPGYVFAWPQNMYQTGGEHPATHGFGDLDTLDPIQLTPRPPGDGTVSLERYACPANNGMVPAFLATVYHEAYALACEQPGLLWPRKVAEFREHLNGALPPLSRQATDQLTVIRKHYRFNDPPSADDDARICSILKRVNEEQP